MKIKRVHIKSFAGIKDKILDFEDGFNLVYGANEAGKSTIENFIKIWLYGIESNRGKIKERKKYMPLTGEKMSGELVVDHNGQGIIIKRVFGTSKKEDRYEILDEVTGEDISLKFRDEPGKSLLGINLSTFTKTLFIGQLAVKVDKDKEEDILEKLSNICGSGIENISVKKAIEKIEKRKKSITGSRKNGVFHELKEKNVRLNEELREGYKLADSNIENEKKLIETKQLKEELKKNIKDIDEQKKYIRQSKLKDDYDEINIYSNKINILKKRQSVLEEEFNGKYRYITTDLLDEISEERIKYLNLLEIKDKNIEKLNELKNIYNTEKKHISKYDELEHIEYNSYEKVYKLYTDQKIIKNKLDEYNKNQEFINKSKLELLKQSGSIESIEFIGKHRKEIDELLLSYKEGLKELKYKIENQSEHKFDRNAKGAHKKIIIINITVILLSIIFICAILANETVISIGCIPFYILLIRSYMNNSMAIRNNKIVMKNSDIIQTLKNRVDDDEEEINLYIAETNCDTYEEFIEKLTKYDKYKSYKDNFEQILKQKEREFDEDKLNKLQTVYANNQENISVLFNIFSCETVDEILIEIKKYDQIKISIFNIKNNIEQIENEILNLDIEIKYKEENISKKKSIIGLSYCSIINLNIKIKEYIENMSLINEIKAELKSVEDTYKILVKDRNIQNIKADIDVDSDTILKCKYKSVEEADEEIRVISNSLLKVEKEIKDLEHVIEMRYIGKREIAEIQEDVSINEENIFEIQKEVNALNIAENVLHEAFDEARKSIGPELNNMVIKRFNNLTNSNYEEVKISEDYNIKMRNNGILFDSDILSNGAKDQLYLSLRLSFVEMLFRNKKVPLFLDDAFVQYDDMRRRQSLKLISNDEFEQILFFTCQSIEKSILDCLNENYKYIEI